MANIMLSFVADSSEIENTTRQLMLRKRKLIQDETYSWKQKVINKDIHFFNLAAPIFNESTMHVDPPSQNRVVRAFKSNQSSILKLHYRELLREACRMLDCNSTLYINAHGSSLPEYQEYLWTGPTPKSATSFGESYFYSYESIAKILTDYLQITQINQGNKRLTVSLKTCFSGYNLHHSFGYKLVQKLLLYGVKINCIAYRGECSLKVPIGKEDAKFVASETEYYRYDGHNKYRRAAVDSGENTGYYLEGGRKKGVMISGDGQEKHDNKIVYYVDVNNVIKVASYSRFKNLGGDVNFHDNDILLNNWLRLNMLDNAKYDATKCIIEYIFKITSNWDLIDLYQYLAGEAGAFIRAKTGFTHWSKYKVDGHSTSHSWYKILKAFAIQWQLNIFLNQENNILRNFPFQRLLPNTPDELEKKKYKLLKKSYSKT